MNAVLLRESDAAESELMASNERDDLSAQIAELRADVRHIQSDTTDIKAELRMTNQRVDALKDSLASAKVWALGLYLALSGSLLYVLARGFKWL
jgi:peptidoglycan hydrolase CwlO-like protein